MRLVAATDLGHDAPILDVGCGTSGFLAGLLHQRYRNLLATDISATALEQHRRQLGRERADRVLWLADDVTDPRQLRALEPILLWHDQGLLQELTQVTQQTAYRQLLDHLLMPGGWLIIAAPDASSPAGKGAYTAEQLAALLGEEYHSHQHLQAPYGRLTEPAQPNTYALFQWDWHPPRGVRPAHSGNL